MTDKIKVLWVGDGGVASGFARVNHNIIKNLPDKFEVHHLAVNYHGDPFPGADHLLYPADPNGKGDHLGYGRIRPMIEKLNPDIVFILNDAWVIYDYARFIPKGTKVVAYVPVDAKPMYNKWAEVLNLLTQVVTYTEYGKEAFEEVYDFDKEIKVIPHGIDTTQFFPIDQKEARRTLSANIPEDGFIVFNGNRNTERKRVDLTLKAFSEFAKDKDDVYLYLHMGRQDAGYDVIRLGTRYNLKDGQILMTDPKLSPGNYVSDEVLNLIYNASDVGINTSQGEGWGLVAFEQGLCGVPQLVPNYSATAEIYPDDTVMKINYTHTKPYTMSLTEGAVISVEDAVNKLNKYYYDPELRKTHGSNLRNFILQPQFRWENITKQFVDIFEEILENDNDD